MARLQPFSWKRRKSRPRISQHQVARPLVGIVKLRIAALTVGILATSAMSETRIGLHVRIGASLGNMTETNRWAGINGVNQSFRPGAARSLDHDRGQAAPVSRTSQAAHRVGASGSSEKRALSHVISCQQMLVQNRIVASGQELLAKTIVGPSIPSTNAYTWVSIPSGANGGLI